MRRSSLAQLGGRSVVGAVAVVGALAALGAGVGRDEVTEVRVGWVAGARPVKPGPGNPGAGDEILAGDDQNPPARRG